MGISRFLVKLRSHRQTGAASRKRVIVSEYSDSPFVLTRACSSGAFSHPPIGFNAPSELSVSSNASLQYALRHATIQILPRILDNYSDPQTTPKCSTSQYSPSREAGHGRAPPYTFANHHT